MKQLSDDIKFKNPESQRVVLPPKDISASGTQRRGHELAAYLEELAMTHGVLECIEFNSFMDIGAVSAPPPVSPRGRFQA